MSDKEQVTAWVTKYTMSNGVVQKVGGRFYEGSFIFRMDESSHDVWCGPKDYHLTAEGARIDAERRKTAKIASLKKQITKIEAMEIVIPE